MVLVAVTWSGGGLARRFACVYISGHPCCVLSYIHTFWSLRRQPGTFVGPLRVWAYILLFLCTWVCGMFVLWLWCALRWRVVPSFRLRAGVPHTMLLSVRAAQSIESIESIRGWLGGGVVLVAVVCLVAGTSPCLYLVVFAAAHTGGACMGIPRGRLAPAGTLACVSWCGVPFSVFPCGALCLGGLFPLMLSHTLLVSWRPRPMRTGDDSGRALLLLVARSLCPFPCALRTTAPFLPEAAWRIL